MKEQMGMMGGMMGGMNPMEMMQKMSGMGMKMMDQMGKEFNPMEMCRKMTESVTKAAEMGSYATPEVRALFEDWVGEVEKEILTFVEAEGEVQTKDIAEKLKINEGSVIFFISRLAQLGKIKIKGIVIGENKGEANTNNVVQSMEKASSASRQENSSC
ncbi:MAG: hypothetical protein A4E53_00834 [Pelotomaculum sp. PtaB.Bin104]|nr:MAG: hypothetical protein A4E53_00834 [Pelotomaculum sp. PtaB.Bin104]